MATARPVILPYHDLAWQELLKPMSKEDRLRCLLVVLRRLAWLRERREIEERWRKLDEGQARLL